MQSLLALASLSALIACGATCEQLSEERASRLKPGAMTEAPHLILDLPAPILEARFNAALAEIKPVPLRLNLGKLSKLLGALNLRPKAIQLLESKADTLRFNLTFDVSQGKERLFDITAEALLKPKLSKQRIAFKVGPQSLRGLKPKISPSASKRLLKMIKRRAGSSLSALLPEAEIRKLINVGLARLADEALPLLRDEVLKRAVKATTFDFKLPEALPLTKLKVSTPQGHRHLTLRFALWTGLVVSEGISAPAKPSGLLTARLSGGALAALGNLAIARGEIPGRFTLKGKPDPEGPFEANLGWRAEDERPLKVDAWRLTGDCVHATISAKPHLKLLRTSPAPSLELRADDIALETIQGDALLSLGAWIASLWSDPPEISKKILASTDLKIASQSFKITLKRARLKQSLDLSFDLEPRP